MRVLFVCLGNICRSPLAEGLARHRAAALGLDWEFDSAGTGSWHVGHAPDPRARAEARRRATPIDDLRARQVVHDDFQRFDLILAADRSVLRALEALRPPAARAELALLLDKAGVESRGEVPDPYFGDAAGFAAVYALLERAVDALLAGAGRA